MIISAMQTMQTYVIGQSENRREARTKRINGYRYGYVLSGIKPDEMTLKEAYEVISAFMYDIMEVKGVKDWEISVDLTMPMFNFKFFCENELDKKYSADLLFVEMDTPKAENGEYIITYETKLYGKSELPKYRQDLEPICQIIELDV